ncbi:MAG: Rho-type gtpase-activating protein [Thelocarpon superellum]|nr:MAG: Rho-type gtpase-activating protein [Thelocarpon superellum]
MESPAAPAESPGELDDVAHPCKGCGEILEEGKAFELAGNRWHIDCFRCNTCGTLLDSDANLLLLGDGSLICNNCTYSCNACGNKIEDLAILTGDQAFCASCFTCRNCKRKIDNLRYARTSQGIFCMTCHETLMARRRKKSRAAAQQKAAANGQSPMLLDKSLPSLPPSAVPEAVLSPEQETPPSETHSETPTEMSPHPRMPEAHLETPKIRKRDRSPLRHGDSKRGMGGPPNGPDEAEPRASPSTNQLNSSTSFASQAGNISLNGDEHSDSFTIPLVLDTAPVFGPATTAESPIVAPPPLKEDLTAQRDYFSMQRTSPRPPTVEPLSPASSTRDVDGRHPSVSAESVGTVSLVSERERQGSTDSSLRGLSNHILPRVTGFQERERQGSTDSASRAFLNPTLPQALDEEPTNMTEESQVPSIRDVTPERRDEPAPSHVDDFRLQEAPKSKKAVASRMPRSETQSPVAPNVPASEVPRSVSGPASHGAKHTPDSLAPTARSELQKTVKSGLSTDSPRLSFESRRRDEAGPLPTSAPSASPSIGTQVFQKPQRKDSLRGHLPRHAVPRKEIGATSAHRASSISPRSRDFPVAPTSTTLNQGSVPASTSSESSKVTPKTSDSPPPYSAYPQPRPSNRLAAATKASPEEYFTTPRAPPQPPTLQSLSPDHSVSTTQSDPSRNGAESVSPTTPNVKPSDELMGEEEMARILDDNDEGSASLLRRVSSAVRHGRSFSDMESRARGPGGKWSRSPINGHTHAGYGGDLNSPTSGSPEGRDKEGSVALKQELRRSAQKIAELESRIHDTADMKSLETKLREKRSTVAFLDSQRELIVRELEVLTENVSRVKTSHQPVDMDKLKSKVVRDFAMSLERLKDTYGPELEELIRQKNQLTEENAALARARDQAIEETEQLNLKNAQLADLNNELTHQIQERYKANRDPTGPMDGARNLTNGLGIYSNQYRERLDSVDSRELLRPGTGYTGSTSSSMQGVMGDSVDAEPAAVLSSPHVVNIRKGQVKKFNWKKGGQQVAKGVSKGFKGAFSSSYPQQPYAKDGQMIEGMPYNGMPAGESPGFVPNNASRTPGEPRPGGLGLFGRKGGMPGKMPSSGNLSYVTAEAPGALFGSELIERAEFERRPIPSVITHCIEEVELRGMDIEGIYRKTGGNSQVKVIQEGFERNDDYDISDPGLDITAVTSVLKQYLRRLPTPLLTYDVYDGMLESNNIPDDEQRIHAMRSAMQKLPTKHRDCLEFLIFHLARVAMREKENLMTPKNLAVVFAPTIMRDNSLEREMTDMHAKNTAIQFLIENNKSIFLGA